MKELLTESRMANINLTLWAEDKGLIFLLFFMGIEGMCFFNLFPPFLFLLTSFKNVYPMKSAPWVLGPSSLRNK